MLKFPSENNIFDDVEFIQKNYAAYFSSLTIYEKSDDMVCFYICPIDEPER